MKTLKLVLAAMIILAATSCKKDFETVKPTSNSNNNGNNNNLSGVTLNFQLESKKGDKVIGKGAKGKSVDKVLGEIISGASVTGDIAYKFRFWLEPSTGTTIAKGSYTITYNATGVAVYSSSILENSIDFSAPYVGTYTLTCSGTYNSVPFSYTGVSIVVTSGSVSPLATSPVTIKSLTVVSSTVNVNCAIDKTELDAIGGTNYFNVERIDGNSFTLTNLPASQVIGDSVYFTFSFPVATLTDVDFNAGKYNTSNNPIWLTASMPTSNPSILYAGTSVGDYFRVRFTVSGAVGTLSAPNGTVLMTVNMGTNPTIPGNSGDDAAHGYTIRWSGLIQYCDFMSNAASPVFRYKITPTGAWTTLIATLTTGTTTYYQVTLPSGVSGTIYFQFGNSVSSVFVPLTNLSNSMYWDPVTQCLVVTI